MAKGRAKVWIVTMPDGSICDFGLSRISADHALAGAVRTWLHEELFGRIEWGSRYSYGALYHIWKGMEAKGWRVHEVEPFALPTEGGMP